MQRGSNNENHFLSFVCISCYTGINVHHPPKKSKYLKFISVLCSRKERNHKPDLHGSQHSSSRSYHLWEEATQRSGQSPSGPKGQLPISPSTACRASCRGAPCPQPTACCSFETPRHRGTTSVCAHRTSRVSNDSRPPHVRKSC